jgi:hypothetical protein
VGASITLRQCYPMSSIKTEQSARQLRFSKSLGKPVLAARCATANDHA